MATLLLNLTPSTSINNGIPFSKQFNKPPSYDHFHFYGCICYLHISPPHKLAPRSTICVFLEYPSQHQGYWHLNLSSRKIIISHHFTFYESSFPFKYVSPNDRPPYTFLDHYQDMSAISRSLLEIKNISFTTKSDPPSHTPPHDSHHVKTSPPNLRPKPRALLLHLKPNTTFLPLIQWLLDLKVGSQNLFLFSTLTYPMNAQFLNLIFIPFVTITGPLPSKKNLMLLYLMECGFFFLEPLMLMYLFKKK